MLGAVLLIAVVVVLVGFALLVSTAPNKRRADAPWWLAWLFAIPFVGSGLGASEDNDGGGGDSGYDSGYDFGRGDSGGGDGGGGE